MTLKEKFKKIEWGILPISNLQSIECGKIADEFAIGFAEYLHQNYQNAGVNKYVKFSEWNIKTIDYILEIYKKEKGI